MKYIIPCVILAFTLTGCGSSGSSDSSGSVDKTEIPAEGQCSISNNTISIEDNTSCTLSDSDAGIYEISGGGEVSCNNGTMTFRNLSAGSGTINFNGLSLTCLATIEK